MSDHCNCTLDMMLRFDGPLTVERFVQLNWMGDKTVEDLEGEDWVEVWDFQEKVLGMLGELSEEEKKKWAVGLPEVFD